MSYNFNCMNKCECCNRRVLTTAVTTNATNLLLTIPNRTLCNGEEICLIIAQTIPTIANPLKVAVVVNGVTIPVILPCGNALYSSQVRTRRIYRLKFAGDTRLFVLTTGRKCLPCANVSIPALNPPAVALGEVASETSSIQNTKSSSTQKQSSKV